MNNALVIYLIGCLLSTICVIRTPPPIFWSRKDKILGVLFTILLSWMIVISEAIDWYNKRV